MTDNRDSHRPPGRRRRLTRTLAIGGVALALLGVAAWRLTAPPATPPAYAGARPEPREDGYVATTHSVFIAAPPAQVWAWSNDPGRTLEDIVQFDSGFPAVAGTEALVGNWAPGEREGDRRRVRFADGHYLAEEVLVDTPTTFRYLIWGFTSMQRFAVQHGLAEFSYEPEADGTRLTWTYSLLPRLGVARPFVESFAETTMAPMMTATLSAMRDGIEEAATS